MSTTQLVLYVIVPLVLAVISGAASITAAVVARPKSPQPDHVEEGAVSVLIDQLDRLDDEARRKDERIRQLEQDVDRLRRRGNR